MKIDIVWLEDTSYCETCGPSWADGARVVFEDGTELNLEPYAHCLGGVDYSKTGVFKAILKHLGHELEVLN